MSGTHVHTARGAGWRMPLALTGLVVATRAAAIYLGGMPAADSVVMAAGMAKGMNPDVGLGDATLYGRQLSPALYAIVDPVYPLLFDSPRHIIAFLNWIAVGCAGLMVMPMLAFLRNHMPEYAVAGTVLIAMFSPVLWEWGTYFHPLVPSVLFLMLALAAARRVDATAAGLARLALVLACAMIALAVRAEVLFALPAVLVWSVISPGRRVRNVTVTVLAATAAVACYLFVLDALPHARDSEMHGLKSYAAMIYHMYLRSFSPAGLARSGTWTVLSIGAGTLAAAAYGLLRYTSALRDRRNRRWDRRHALVAAGLLWVLPSLAFWLPQPAPIMRHYVLPALGVTWFAGYLLLAAMAARRSLALVAAIAALNIAVPEAAYRGYNATHPGDAKFPHGAFFYQQQVERVSIARHRALAADVMKAALEHGAAVLVDWTGYAYILHELYTGGYDVERLSLVRRNPNVAFERFWVDGNDLHVVQGIRITPGLPPAQVARGHLHESIRDGLAVFVPSEAAAAGFTSDALGAAVTTY